VNGHRPSAMTTKGPAGTTSVHPAGSENSTPYLIVQMDSVLAPVLAMRDELEVLAEQRMEPVRHAHTPVPINPDRARWGARNQLPAFSWGPWSCGYPLRAAGRAP
jgi:hypothetical protein